MGIREDLEKLAGISDPTTRRLAFLALFSEEYRKRNGGRYPVLVGGMAVELYTQGHYSTRDVDLLCKDERAWEILQEWGFERLPAKRQFYSESLDIALEILGDRLVNEDPEAEARTKFVLFEGLGKGAPDRIRVIALEDLVLDRLNAAVLWKSPEDRLWAEIMLDLGLSSDALGFNLDYLKRKALRYLVWVTNPCSSSRKLVIWACSSLFREGRSSRGRNQALVHARVPRVKCPDHGVKR